MVYLPTESGLKLIQSAVSSIAPQTILQVGAGCYEHSKVLAEALGALDNNAQLTLIAGSTDQPVLDQLNDDGFDQWADVVPQPADQVLPDFYFQENQFDLAVINPGYRYDEAVVSFYYINKMLLQGGKIIVNQADDEKLRALSRHILETGDFSVSAASPVSAEVSMMERFIRDQYKKLPKWIHRQAEIIINPMLLEDAAVLGLDGDVIIFEKITETAEKVEEDVDVDAMIEAMM